MLADFKTPKRDLNKRILEQLFISKLGIEGYTITLPIQRYLDFDTLIFYTSKLSNNVAVKYMCLSDPLEEFMFDNQRAKKIARTLLKRNNGFITKATYKAGNFIILIETQNSRSNRRPGRYTPDMEPDR